MVGLTELDQLDYGVQYQRGQPSATQVSGLAGLAAPATLDIARANNQTIADMRNLGSMPSVKPPAAAIPSMKEQASKPVLAISRSTNKIWANGKLFTTDDAQGAIESEQFVGGAPVPAPAAEAGDWEPLSVEAYSEHLAKIKNPSLTTLASKNFGIGVDSMQMLGGYGMQFLGATETGQGIVRQQLEDIRKNAPYQRSLEDVPERGAVEWLVANVAQQGPNLIESIVTAAIGAGAGAAAGGGANPFTAVGGAMSAMVGKQAFKKAIMIAVQKQARGEALDAAEEKLLKEATGMTLAATKTLADDVSGAYGGKAILNQLIDTSAGARRQAMAGGAALFSTGQNYATGVADLYGESVEGGQPDRLMAALGGVPYAAAETLPEYLAALRLFKGIGMKVTQAGGRAGRVGTAATNVGVGLGAGAALEGTTEAFQETLGIGMNADVDVDSPEGISRLLNAFAAGAAIGGLVGAGSSLNTGKATDLLSGGTKPAEQGGTTLTSAPEAPPAPYISMPPTAAPTAAQPQGEMFPGTPMGNLPAQVPTGPMRPTAAPGGQIDMFADYQPPPSTPGEPMFIGPEARPLRSALSQVAADSLPGAQPPGAMMLRRGTGGSALAQTADMQGPAMPMPGAPTYAQPSDINPQGELFPSAPTGVQFRAPATPQELPPSADVGGMQLALQPQREPEPPALPRNAMTDRLAQLRRQMEFEQAQQQAAGTRVTPAEQVYDEALLDQPIVLDTEGASTGKNKLTDDGRRRIIAGFNMLDKQQQDAILVEFDNDETKLLDYVRRTKPPVVRKQFAALAKVEPSAFEVKVPKATAPQAAAQPIIEEAPVNALKVRPQPKDNKLQRQEVAKRRQAAEAGGGNRLKQGKAAQAAKPVAPSKRSKLTKEVAAETDREMWDTFFDDGGVGYDALPDKGKADWRKLVVRGDITQAEADAFQAKYAGAPSPKAEGATAAPSKKAEAGTAVAVVEPKKPVEDVEAKRKVAKAQAEQAEIAELASRALSDQAEVEAMIVAYNEAEPGSVESDDALIALIEYSKDGSIGRGARTRAQDYLAYEVDENDIKLAERKLSGEVDNDALDFNLITVTMEQVNNGELRLSQSIVGKLVSAWKRIKDKGMKYGIHPLADYIKGGPQFFNIKNGKVAPKGEGKFSISQWDNPDNPVPAGRIKLIIQRFTSKLAVRPKVYVFRNQADLKANDPKLYARLRAGRPEGDFDIAQAAGYSMNDTVVIFSDRIGSEDHLSFVLAHETLGHFGFRGLMGNADFNALMGKLYDSDPRVKAAADAAMRVRGLSKAEAVEEYMADYAGQLHTRLVARFWKGVKGVLNRVGIRFGDEATRYLLDQSKRYVRTGTKTGVFETSSVLQRAWAVEHGEVGRFSTISLADENERVAEAQRHNANLFPMSLKEAAGRIGDFGGSWDKFKEKFFSLLNYQALRNPGLYEFEKLLDETRQREQYIHNKYNEQLTKLLYRNEAYKEKISRALLLGRVVSTYRLIQKPLSPADRKVALFSIDNDGNVVRNTKAIEDFVQRGIVSFDEMTNGGTYKREIIDGKGKAIVEDVKFSGVDGLTQEQYDDYVLSRRNISEVEIELLEAKYKNFLQNEAISKRAIKRLVKTNKLEGEAEKLLRKTLNKYKEIYVSGYTVDARGNITPGVEQINLADDFLTAVNKALISADAKNDPAVQAFFDNQKDFDDFAPSLEAFRADRKIPDGDLTYMFQNEMKRIILDDVNLGVEEERAKRTMAAGYVPVIRDKAFEVRLEAVDDKGRPVALMEDHKKLLSYSQFDSRSLAQENAEMLVSELEGKTFEAMVKQDDGSYATQEVSLRVKYGEALSQVTADPALNLDEFMHGLRLFKINLTPDKMTKIITTLTEAGDSARKRLEFSNTPGYDKSTGVFAMSRHIQMRAATIAKTLTRPRMRELLDRNNEDSASLWAGNYQSIIAQHEAWTAATDPALKQHLRHELDHMLYMFLETNPDAKGWDGSRTGFQNIRNNLSETNANRYYNTAQKTMEFLESNQLVSESNFGAGRTVAALRAATSIFQLGGSIAQGVMNLSSPYTNWMPYMASYNSRNGFGGGFGMGSVIAEYHKALTQVGANGIAISKYNTAEYYEKLKNDKAALAASGLTEAEANFLAEEIREGKLIPAQANALLGTARGGISNPMVLRAIDAFMSPFNRTEQASRRAAGLAAFRLAMQRNGGDAKQAREFAIQSLDLTLGEYSVLNRPPAWRDGIQSFLYMYKVYPTTTIQLFRRLDKKGQIIMLGSLWLVAGVAGFPFAEDIEDLVDTIAQTLGLQMGSVRAEFAKLLDDVAPGLSPVVLKGFVNGYLGVPADIAGRFSMGDFVPGTGFLLAGATVGEEVKDILGPMPSMAIGLVSTARDIIATPLSEGQSLQDTLRAAPVTAFRMVGDTWAYASNGAVVDRRGYVVSPEMNMSMMAMRLMGFYPDAAAKEYDAIRIAKRVNNYQKDVVTSYRYAWIKAMQTGNRGYAREIEKAVDEWNKGARGTALEIKDFVRNSQRALKEAKLSATQRTLRSTAKAGRDDTARILDILTQ